MGNLRLSEKERRRLEVFNRVKRGEVSLRKGGELLGLGYRQARRSYSRWQADGDESLVHGLRGKASNRRTAGALKKRVLRLYERRYKDFGPTLAAEYLSEELGEEIKTSTLRRWLMAEGLWKKQKRRGAHRKWRARKDHFGEMVQMDGSEHDWFEGRRARAVLMVMIDDATNLTYAQFHESETTEAAMLTFLGYVRQHGLPRSLYVDRDSIYESSRDATTEEELRGTGPLTQFGRAMKELGVVVIMAHSPQAKGRVERRHAVFQDRLVKDLRIRNVSCLQKANELLETRFLPMLARRFTVPASREANVHRRVGRGINLDRILSFQESRVVQNDWTVRWRNRWFQLTEANQKLSLVGARIVVSERLSGELELIYRGRTLAWEELPGRPERASRKKTKAAGSSGAKKWRPAKNHPWRRGIRRPGE